MTDLPTPGATDHHDGLTDPHLEVEAVEHDRAAERLAQAAQGDLGLVRARAGAGARRCAHWAKNDSVMM